jgi:glucokinase
MTEATLNKSVGYRKAILVNGPPASGKTTIAEGLVKLLDVPLLSMDRVKEALFAVLGTGDRVYNRKLSMASMQVIWSLLVDFPPDGTVIIESWFKTPEYYKIQQNLGQAGVGQFVEVWCTAPSEVLAKRYVDRVEFRPAGHPGKEFATELVEIAQRAEPLGLGPVLTVDTGKPEEVDLSSVARWIKEELG